MDYAKQLRQPEWQQRREEIISASGGVCQHCYAEGTRLHVHHRIYRSGRMAWEYGDEDLIALCPACHRKHHNHELHLRELVAREHLIEHAASLLRGFTTDIFRDDIRVQDMGIYERAGAIAQASQLLSPEDAEFVFKSMLKMFSTDLKDVLEQKGGHA